MCKRHENTRCSDGVRGGLFLKNSRAITISFKVVASKDYDNYWVAEIAIPLKSLRFDPNQKHWGINFSRIDAKHNEYSPWTKVPTNFKSYDLGYTGVLHFPSSPPKNSSNIIFQPYITGNGNEVYRDWETDRKSVV